MSSSKKSFTEYKWKVRIFIYHGYNLFHYIYLPICNIHYFTRFFFSGVIYVITPSKLNLYKPHCKVIASYAYLCVYRKFPIGAKYITLPIIRKFIASTKSMLLQTMIGMLEHICQIQYTCLMLRLF